MLKHVAVLIAILSPFGFAQLPEPPPSKTHPCLIVARYGTDNVFIYRDQYGVPAENLQLSYNHDELNYVLKNGVKVVVYDPKEHESFYDARESCFAGPAQPPR